MAKKILPYLLALLFVYVAYLQLNDPDPLYWVAVYLSTAGILLGKGLGRSSDFWTTLTIGALAAGLLWSAPAVVDYVAGGDFGIIFGDMRGPSYVEPTREFGGLLIALLVLLPLIARQNR